MKSIPIELQDHYNEDATTLCLITRILTKDGTLMGFTDLDVDVEYDPAAVDPHGTGDDWGSAIHRADNGFTPSRIQASADLAVDNAELSGVAQETGITEAQIRAGLFDYAKVRIYRINYMDPSKGHELVQAGTAGQTTFTNNGWKTEFRSLTQQLKQPISKLYSLTCRAKFGDAQCGKSFTWVEGTVTAVGANARRQFTDSAMTEADDYFVGGVVEWTGGLNAGAQMEVDTHESDQLGLALPMAYAIQVGDTFRVRKDCSKEWDDETNGCLFHWGSERKNHFRGEPHIPVADGGSNLIPGAQITRLL